MATSSGIRRRNVPSSTADNESSTLKALDTLKHFDVYTKVHEDYVQKSQAGGYVTMVTSFILALLFWIELSEFCSAEVVDSISVDTRINQKLRIGMNITFPHLRCDEISVDTVDSAGDNQVNVHGGLEKLAIDATGAVVHETAATPKPGACLSCLEAADEGQNKCCNTCEDLKEAYLAKELSYFSVLSTAEQCRNSVGCRIFGKVTVNKVSGNVHVALGHSTVREGKMVHEFNVNDIGDGFNTSHEIHAIAFGDTVPGVLSPLDGTTKVVKHGAYMFHYYIKLVPTVFTDRYGEEVYTNQYSVTDSARNVQVRSGELSGLPGVFIVYDFSPFLMRKTEKVKPWSYIFTSICAILGGIFSIASLVEMALSAFMRGLFGCHPGVNTKG